MITRQNNVILKIWLNVQRGKNDRKKGGSHFIVVCTSPTIKLQDFLSLTNEKKNQYRSPFLHIFIILHSPIPISSAASVCVTNYMVEMWPLRTICGGYHLRSYTKMTHIVVPHRMTALNLLNTEHCQLNCNSSVYSLDKVVRFLLLLYFFFALLISLSL